MSRMDDFRAAHPEYNDLSDMVLADKLHAKFYADMPKEDYYKKLGVSPVAPAVQTDEGLKVGRPGQVHRDLADNPPEQDRKFVDAKGNVMGRTQAAELTGFPTSVEPGKLHSEDLPEYKTSIPHPGVEPHPGARRTPAPGEASEATPEERAEKARAGFAHGFMSAYDEPLGLEEAKTEKGQPVRLPGLGNDAQNGLVGGLIKAGDAALRLPGALTQGIIEGGTEGAIAHGADPTETRRLARDEGVLAQVGVLPEIGAARGPFPKAMVKVAEPALAGKGITEALKLLKLVGEPIDNPVVKENLANGIRQHPSAAVSGVPKLGRAVEMARGFGYDALADTRKEVVGRRVGDVLESSGVASEDVAGEKERLSRQAAPDYAAAGTEVKGAVRQDIAREDMGLQRDAANRLEMANQRGGARIEEAGQEAGALDREAYEETAQREVAAAKRAEQIKAEGEKQALDAIAARSEEGRRAVAAHDKAMADLETKEAKSSKAATGLLDTGWEALDKLRRSARPGDLAEVLNGKVQDFRRRIQAQASGIYERADREAAKGGKRAPKIDTSSAKSVIADFEADIPEDLLHGNPALRRSLDAMKQGKMTFGQIHELRSHLRDLGYSDKLSPELKRGRFNYLSNVVDELINSQANHPQLQKAARILREADDFYSKEMARFRDKSLQQLADNMRSKLPPDFTEVAGQILNSGNTSARREVLNIAGEDGRRKIASAVASQLTDGVRNITGEVDTAAFARRVNEMVKDGSLRDIFPQDYKTIQALARRLEQSTSREKITLGPQDNFVKALQAANKAMDARNDTIKANPVKALLKALSDQGEAEAKDIRAGAAESAAGVLKPVVEENAQVRKMAEETGRSLRKDALRDAAHARLDARSKTKEVAGQLAEAHKDDPLARFANPSIAAEDAAKEVLARPVMLEHLIDRYGADHPAVQMVRKVALDEVLGATLQAKSSTKGVGAAIAKLRQLSERQQNALFPGGIDELVRLGKDLEAIEGPADTSMASMAKGAVLGRPTVDIAHPWRSSWVQQMVYRIGANIAVRPTMLRALRGELEVQLSKNRHSSRYQALQVAAHNVGILHARQDSEQDDATPTPVALPRRASWQDQFKPSSAAGGWRDTLGAK